MTETKRCHIRREVRQCTWGTCTEPALGWLYCPEHKAEARRKYEHAYYLEHRAKALEYQRQYKRRRDARQDRKSHPRGAVKIPTPQKTVFNAHDLMMVPAEKFERRLNDIIHRRMGLTI